VLDVAFEVADDEGLLLLDLKDLRSMLTFVADNAQDLRTRYGSVSSASVGAIQRSLLGLERDGGELFFGEPALELADFLKLDGEGFGVVNVLAADKLIRSPKLYATFLLWLLSELFEELPEVGDPEKPKLVFFFDEAHLLFDDAPKALLDTVSQVVRLIRSKGVGIYFVTQSPSDVPDDVLGQLGNRVQHALRAFTPRDQRAVRAAAQTFRPNPKLDTEQVITELGKGEALVSFLEGNGVPGIVDRTLIRPPTARLGVLTAAERAAVVGKSPMKGKYDQAIDEESAFEKLQQRTQDGEAPGGTAQGEAVPASGGLLGGLGTVLGGIFGTSRPRGQRLSTGQHIARAVTRSVTSRIVGKMAGDIGKSIAGSMGNTVGRAIVRGTLGGILRR
jgi:DNA double-strand break repair helicase HerA and related ATPase